MTSGDPLRRFSVELAISVLSYLTLLDLARCELVSRGWRDFVQAWIVSSGFRAHFPGLLPEDEAQNSVRVVRIFKELGETSQSACWLISY